MSEPIWTIEQHFPGLTAYVVPVVPRENGCKIVLATCHGVGDVDPLLLAERVCQWANDERMPSWPGPPSGPMAAAKIAERRMPT